MGYEDLSTKKHFSVRIMLPVCSKLHNVSVWCEVNCLISPSHVSAMKFKKVVITHSIAGIFYTFTLYQLGALFSLEY